MLSISLTILQSGPYITRTEKILNLLRTPRYETKGLSTLEKNEVLEGWKINEGKYISFNADRRQREVTDSSVSVTEVRNKFVEKWLENTQANSLLLKKGMSLSTSTDNPYDHIKNNNMETDTQTTYFIPNQSNNSPKNYGKSTNMSLPISANSNIESSAHHEAILPTTYYSLTTIEGHQTNFISESDTNTITTLLPVKYITETKADAPTATTEIGFSYTEDYSINTLLPVTYGITEYEEIIKDMTLKSGKQPECNTNNFIKPTPGEYNTSATVSEGGVTVAIIGAGSLTRSEDGSSTKVLSEFCESPSEYQPSSSCVPDTSISIDISGESGGSHKKCNEKQKREISLLETNSLEFRTLLANTSDTSGEKNKSTINAKVENKMQAREDIKRNLETNAKVTINRRQSNKSFSVESADESEPEQNILIQSARKDRNSGKRIRDKGHCCLFCDKIMVNLARHYELIHKNETQVAKILIMPKGSRKRKDAFEELARTADFHHNCEVINKKQGALILVRRPAEKEKCNLGYSNYGPCPHCLGFMMKKRLWHHIKYNCKSTVTSTTDRQKRNIISESNALLIGLTHLDYSSEYNAAILSKFKCDDISEVCKKDSTILKFGYLQFEKYGNSQCDLIRQTMRQLGRFLIQVQYINPDIKNLSDCLLPTHFDLVLMATKSLCQTTRSSTHRPEFDIPSLALKLGHALKKCIIIHRGMALRKGDLQHDELYLAFLNLMEMEWSLKISSCALSTMHKRKFNHKQLLPLTEDLIRLTKYLDKEITMLREKLSRNIDYKTWRNLASCTLSRIILFNKKRSGEASKMTIEQYATRPTFKDQGTQELLISLSPLEKHLASTMEVVDIEGKRGQRVPVIVTPNLKSAIDFLIRTRSTVNISRNNPYIFAPADSELGHLRGHDCLRSACNEANLIHPEFITGTKLRKYIATVSQIFNLGENEADWLARHLGHDIRVHRNFYRLHENAVETTKISRLLLAVEKGEANRYAGRSLDEINIEDLPGLEEDVDEILSIPPRNDEDSNAKNDDVLSSDDELPLVLYKRKIPSNKGGECNSESKQHKNGEGSSMKRRKIVEEKTSLKRCKKTPWTTDEIKCVLAFFKFDLKKEFLPGKEKCIECIKKYPVLERRRWTDIKYYLKNYYSRNRRLLTKSLK